MKGASHKNPHVIRVYLCEIFRTRKSMGTKFRVILFRAGKGCEWENRRIIAKGDEMF